MNPGVSKSLTNSVRVQPPPFLNDHNGGRRCAGGGLYEIACGGLPIRAIELDYLTHLKLLRLM